ncbi:MAG: hypothetical protein ACOX0A_08565 [Thermoguttaceae bacterium]|jgi:hypothetical protein
MKKQTALFLAAFAIFAVSSVVWHILFSPKNFDDTNVPFHAFEVAKGHEGETAFADSMLAEKAPELRALFSEPDDWRLNANMIKIPRASCYFLFKGEPKISESGRTMTLNACTVVHLPLAQRIWRDGVKRSEAVSMEERVKHAIVFEVADQIELNFSRSITEYNRINREDMNLSLFETGEFRGVVKIRVGDETNPDAFSFSLLTRDLVFNTRQCHTNSEVAFMLGTHSGKGEGLTIDFETPETFQRPNRPISPDGVAATAREQGVTDELIVNELVDDMVEYGNLGVGFSIRKIEINRLKGSLKLDLTALDLKTGDLDTGGVDTLYVDCKGDVHFEPTTHEPGQWCLRFNDGVTATAMELGAKVVSFKGETFYLYFQDPEIVELEKRYPSARAVLTRRNPTGMLARLKASVLRATGGDKPLVVSYRPAVVDENSIPRVFQLTAMQAYYDDTGVFKLINRPDVNTISVDENGEFDPTPEVVRLRVEEYDRHMTEPSVTTLTSDTIQARFTKKDGFINLTTWGSGSLSTNVRGGRGELIPLQTFWEKGLLLEPVVNDKIPDAYQLLSSGQTRCSLGELGSFYSAEANFWFQIGKSRLLDAGTNVAPGGATDVGFTPIAAKFSGDVRLETPTGIMTVQDSVDVHFSDRSVAEQASPVDADAKRTFVSSNDDGGAFAKIDSSYFENSEERFELSCKRLEVWCELAPDSEENSRTSLRVLRSALSGNVDISQLDSNLQKKAFLIADSVAVENPLTEMMKLRFQANTGSALFHVNELALKGRDIMIDMGRNAFQVDGPGEVTIQPPQKSADAQFAAESTSNVVAAASAITEPVVVSWTSAMAFDGQMMRFLSTPDTHVVLSSDSANIQCSETRLALKQSVELLNLQFDNNVAPDVDYVECLGAGLDRPTRLNFNARDKESLEYVGFYHMTCQSVRVDASTGIFTIENQGELLATLLSESSVAGLGANAVASLDRREDERAPSASRNAAASNPKRWVCVNAQFNGASGSFKDGSAQIDGGVAAVIGDVSGPSETIAVADPSSWPEGAIKFNCRRALYQGAGGGAEMKMDVEIEARGDVTFRTGDLSGSCEALAYAASKNLVTLTGAENAPAALIRQAYSGAPRTNIAEFMTGRLHLDTGKFEVENLTLQDNLGSDSILNKSARNEK